MMRTHAAQVGVGRPASSPCGAAQPPRCGRGRDDGMVVLHYQWSYADPGLAAGGCPPVRPERTRPSRHYPRPAAGNTVGAVRDGGANRRRGGRAALNSWEVTRRGVGEVPARQGPDEYVSPSASVAVGPGTRPFTPAAPNRPGGHGTVPRDRRGDALDRRGRALRGGQGVLQGGHEVLGGRRASRPVE